MIQSTLPDLHNWVQNKIKTIKQSMKTEWFAFISNKAKLEILAEIQEYIEKPLNISDLLRISGIANAEINKRIKAVFITKGIVYPIINMDETEVVCLSSDSIKRHTIIISVPRKLGEVVSLEMVGYNLQDVIDRYRYDDWMRTYIMPKARAEVIIAGTKTKEIKSKQVIRLSAVDTLTIMELADGDVDAMVRIMELLTKDAENAISASRILPILSDYRIRGEDLNILCKFIVGNDYQLLEYLLEQVSKKDLWAVINTKGVTVRQGRSISHRNVRETIADYIRLKGDSNKDLD